ncbi:MAG TPA: alpha/beta hydrolase [Flavipsychrobacter sp.]|nr:alpha/beta hydrolase [Flavipsychrobacter sp.]
MSKPLYIFSGLGADERIFQRLDFSDSPANFIQWIAPEPDEAIEHYAQRLLAQIKTENPVLIGLSFGGMMAVEVAKLIRTERIILISSAKTKAELPPYFQAGSFQLHHIIPATFFKSSNPISNWLFGADAPADKKLLKQILKDTDPIFLKWAMDKIASWKNHTVPNNIIHIHGTNDRILPIKYVRCDKTIQNGGHMMVWNRAEELNDLLRKYL